MSVKTPLADQSLGAYLDTLAAREPTPGGGAVAAVHLSQAAALVAMVARYTTRAKDAEHRPTIDRIIAAAEDARTAALTLAQADIAAFAGVGDAYRLPKNTQSETDARARAITTALQEAARVPAAVIAQADEVLALAAELLPIGNSNVITDIAAAADAARAAVSSSAVNVEINLVSLAPQDGSPFTPMLERVSELTSRADAISAEVLHIVRHA